MCDLALDLVLSRSRGRTMTTFQQAYEAAAARHAPEDWADLRPDLRINVIYEEMRRLILKLPLP